MLQILCAGESALIRGSVPERVALPSLTGQVLLTQREDQSSCTHSAGGFSWPRPTHFHLGASGPALPLPTPAHT